MKKRYLVIVVEHSESDKNQIEKFVKIIADRVEAEGGNIRMVHHSCNEKVIQALESLLGLEAASKQSQDS